jgi:hypothetical protein
MILKPIAETVMLKTQVMQAREERRVRGVIMTAVAAIEQRRRGPSVAASILNVFSDLEYNRYPGTIEII